MERFTAERENHIIREIFINSQTISAVARAEGISINRVRQIKETGLRKLRIGKAKRELLQKFDIVESKLYRGTLKNFREHNTSIVEYLAMQRTEAEEHYKQHLAEIEERRKKRLSFSIEGDRIKGCNKMDRPASGD